MPMSDRAWEDLLAYVADRKVVPIIGPELLAIPTGQGEINLYRLIAEKVAAQFGLQFGPESEHELNDLVYAYLEQNRRARVDDLYRPINDVLKGLAPAVPTPLRQLATIRGFDLFVTTSFDSLIVEALNQERFSGAAQTLDLTYAPNLSTEAPTQLPASRRPGEAIVVHLFGKASSSPDYAIHDEDLLEFVHTLQSRQDTLPVQLFTELRQRHLLIIGCPFPDWLSRFFIRTASGNRLSLGRPRNFIAAHEVAKDRNLTLFLEYLSYNTTVFPGEAKEFVAELHRRWIERHPAVPPLPAPEALSLAPVEKGAIFVSYAHEDIAAARALGAAVREIGGDLYWLDKERLLPGSEWEAEIQQAIRRDSRLFLAVISRNTEARAEGFFRREWREAVERSKGIQGRDFLIPIVIDAEYAPDQYRLIPEEFRRYDFGWAPEGRPEERLRDKLIIELRALRREEKR